MQRALEQRSRFGEQLDRRVRGRVCSHSRRRRTRQLQPHNELELCADRASRYGSGASTSDKWPSGLGGYLRTGAAFVATAVLPRPPAYDMAARRKPTRIRNELLAIWKVVSENIYFGLVFLSQMDISETKIVLCMHRFLFLFEKQEAASW